MAQPRNARMTLGSLINSLTAVMAVILAVTIPVELGSIAVYDTPPAYLIGLRWAGYLIFTLDLIVTVGRRRLGSCSGCRIAINILSALPVGPVLNHMGGPQLNSMILNAAYLLPVLRLFSVHSMFRDLQHAKPMLTGRLRMAVTLGVIALFVHWVGCGLMVVLGQELGITLQMRYLRAVYWAVTTMTTVGYGDITPDKENAGQLLFTILIMIIGAGSFGFIIGNIATIMSNRDFARTQHLDKMQRLSAFMHHNRVPLELKERILGYHAYLWQTRRGYDESFILNELPPSIRSDMEMFLRRDIVRKAPMFSEADSEMIRRIVPKLKTRVAMPGEYIVRKGEIGSCMFFIGSGSVDVFADSETSVATLNEGDFFGEIAVLKECPRTATVIAAQYCDLYILDKEDLDQISRTYPAFAEHIRKHGEERLGHSTTG